MATVKLSTLDQGAGRSYIRYAVAFGCENNKVDQTIEKLSLATKSIIYKTPMLAGSISPDNQGKQALTVTLEDLKAFSVTIQRSNESYAAICRAGVIPKDIAKESFTPLSDLPASQQAPALAIRANFITGGLILVVYLHHAVADLRGMTTILRTMAEGTTTTAEHTVESLASAAEHASLARARLSDADGAPSFFSLARDVEMQMHLSMQQQRNLPATHITKAAILSFNHSMILSTTEMLNRRRRICALPGTLSPAARITPRDTLLALLWRAIVRARGPATLTTTTSISFPVDLRGCLLPPLEAEFIGNAEITVVAVEQAVHLGGQYDLATLQRTTGVLHQAAAVAASERLVRSRVALMNEQGPFSRDLGAVEIAVRDWSSVPVGGLGLGLGLGGPNAIRRTGREALGGEVVVLPVGRGWEVQVEMEEGVVESMLRDEPLRAWLVGVAV